MKQQAKQRRDAKRVMLRNGAADLAPRAIVVSSCLRASEAAAQADADALEVRRLRLRGGLRASQRSSDGKKKGARPCACAAASC